MIASEQEKVFRVLDLEREQEADHLHRLLAAVDVVAEEEVVGVGRKAAVLEKAQQVVELAVDVAAHFDRRLELEKHRLRLHETKKGEKREEKGHERRPRQMKELRKMKERLKKDYKKKIEERLQEKD